MSNSKLVTRSAFVRNASEDILKTRQVEFVISTESVDTYNTVFKLDGWNLSRYNQNPVVCYQHRAGSADPDDVIGFSEIRFEDDKMIGVVTFEDAETNPKAEKVLRKISNGTLRMASINARIVKGRWGKEELGEKRDVMYFTEHELMEWSIVTIGSNPDAHKRNQITLDEMIAEVKQEGQGTEEIQVKRSVREAQLIINS